MKIFLVVIHLVRISVTRMSGVGGAVRNKDRRIEDAEAFDVDRAIRAETDLVAIGIPCATEYLYSRFDRFRRLDFDKILAVAHLRDRANLAHRLALQIRALTAKKSLKRIHHGV